jgi:folate-binding protein YgfZ
MWVAVTRDVVTVAGPDARPYLHGQVSQDVASMAAGDTRWTLVLAPNGKVDVLARIRCVDDERFELDTEQGFGAALHERLSRFRIRVKADLELSTAELHANCDSSARTSVSTADGSLGPGGAQESRAYIGWWDQGLWRDDPPEGAAAGTADDYEAARVAAGWPAMGSEIVPGERIPAEVAVAPVAVNLTKGCYPGQELVERMDSRGSQAPRQLRILPVDVGAKPGDVIDDVVLTSVAGGKALGYVKRGAAVGMPPGPNSS